jgi:hypothetical protein
MQRSTNRLLLGLLTTLLGAWGFGLPAQANPGPEITEASTEATEPVDSPNLAELNAEPSVTSTPASELGSLDSLTWDGRMQIPPVTGAADDAEDPAAVVDDAAVIDAANVVEPANRSTRSEVGQPDIGQDAAQRIPTITEAGTEPGPAWAELDQADLDLPDFETFELTDDAEPRYTLTLEPEEEVGIPANGRAAITLVGQVTNPDGDLITEDVVVSLTTTAGEFIGDDHDPDSPGFQVLATGGEFSVQLRSSIEAQQVTVQAFVDGKAARGLDEITTRDRYPTLEASTQINFFTDLRPSLVSGVIDIRLGRAGTNFWGSFRDWLNPDVLNRGTELSFDTALFGTGSIGEWEYRGAYNNTRALNERCDGNGLYRDVQFCDQIYPVYGDSSTTDFLTPSIDSLYLRFQRDSIVPNAQPDYFMWGDYSTREFAAESQQFSATNRQLHGFKGNYTFENGIQITAMFADNVRPFQRDTIVPDGTSGFYFLSRRLVLRGSEDVYLETEELNRPGTVVERQPLSRGSDYEIDYDRGTLLFRQPVTAIDANPLGPALVRRIVVTYQVEDFTAGGNLYAGRLQYRAPGLPGSLLGATLLYEDQGMRDFSLYGFDLMVPLGESGQVVGEIARSSLNTDVFNRSGMAYRLEASGTLLEGVAGRAYLSSTERGFDNTATTSFRPGQTRWGAQVQARVGDQTQFRARFDQETNEGPAPEVITDLTGLLRPGIDPVLGAPVDNTLTTVQAGVTQQIGTATLGVDFVNRNRRDRTTDLSTRSNQLVSRFNLPISGNLDFVAQSELNLGAEQDILYPTRNLVGLEWAVQPGVTMRLAQQFLSGGAIGPRSITSLDTIANYELGDNTTLTNRYSLAGGFNGMTGQGAIGLNHRLTLTPGLRANFSFERIYSDGFGTTGAGDQFAQPFAVGAGASALAPQDSTAYSVGLEYTGDPDFQASARAEHRTSNDGNNLVLSAAAAGRITPSLTGLMRFQHANFANQTITGILGDSTNLKLGLAYRDPGSDVFNALLSYEFRNNPSSTPDSILLGVGSGSQDHTLGIEAIYAPDWRWEFYGRYGLRASNATLADDFRFGNTIHLGQLRATYRFAYRWDITGEARWIGQPVVGYGETGYALEAGYYLNPDLRLGAGYSFGRAQDGSFIGGGESRSAGGLYLGLTVKVNQLFNAFGAEPLPETVPSQDEIETAQERSSQ